MMPSFGPKIHILKGNNNILTDPVLLGINLYPHLKHLHCAFLTFFVEYFPFKDMWSIGIKNNSLTRGPFSLAKLTQPYFRNAGNILYDLENAPGAA